MNNADIYLYGQVLMTRSFLLAGRYPEPDGYAEARETYHLIGGETGCAANVLDSLGCTVRAEGCFLGRETREPVLRFFANKHVDLSLMTYDESFEGLEDCVIIDRDTRTCFGRFGAYFDDPVHRWNQPTARSMAGCKVAAIDPFFPGTSDEVARLCVEAGIPYVTIDCRHDTYLHRHAAINAVSGEFLRNDYRDVPRADAFALFQQNATGLVIFTAGSKPLTYGRKGETPKQFPPYDVPVVSTLGAGDTFKAGCTYALFRGMDDEATVSFASACAAAACMHFPIALDPPTLARIEQVQKGQA